MNLNSSPDKVDVVGIASDGGTLAIEVHLDGEVLRLFVDKRMDTSTPHEIFKTYPGEEGAEMLAPDSTLVQDIKRRVRAELD